MKNVFFIVEPLKQFTNVIRHNNPPYHLILILIPKINVTLFLILEKRNKHYSKFIKKR